MGRERDKEKRTAAEVHKSVHFELYASQSVLRSSLAMVNIEKGVYKKWGRRGVFLTSKGTGALRVRRGNIVPGRGEGGRGMEKRTALKGSKISDRKSQPI